MPFHRRRTNGAFKNKYEGNNKHYPLKIIFRSDIELAEICIHINSGPRRTGSPASGKPGHRPTSNKQRATSNEQQSTVNGTTNNPATGQLLEVYRKNLQTESNSTNWKSTKFFRRLWSLGLPNNLYACNLPKQDIIYLPFFLGFG